MSHISLLLSLNALNTFVFWFMWRGFFTTEQFREVWFVSIVQALTIFASFLSYGLRNKLASQRLIRWSNFTKDTDRFKTTYLGCMVGAYGLASTNIFIAPIIYLINGTIDVWVSGNAT